MKNYTLITNQESNAKNSGSGNPKKKVGTIAAVRSLWPLLKDEKKNLAAAFGAMLVNSVINLLVPFIIGYTVDHYVLTKQYDGVLRYSFILFCMLLVGLATSYFQTKWMGSISQRMLYKLRMTIFNKLQELPVAFFNQNKAGDLISRINNDTDKLNQFFSQSLIQFISNIFIMVGAGVFLLSINLELGAASLIPAVFILVITQLFSPWIKRKNAENLKSTGGLSSEIQESLQNFKVIVAFNRRDYFRQKFAESNDKNYKTAISAGTANNFLAPIYAFAATVAQIIVIAFGIYLILHGQFTLGLLISFLSYSTNFYAPLRQLAALWANFQTALAGWDRINAILVMDNDFTVISENEAEKDPAVASNPNVVLSFKHVHFSYTEDKEVLHDITFTLEKGKTYALVGPTGGGKTTTASLMARIFDATKGTVFLDGRDIRSYAPGERTQKIGFILQEPFLFTGTVRDNIIYGNEAYTGLTPEETAEKLKTTLAESGLENLVTLFDKGLDTEVLTSGDSISLGQRQIIAFVRAVLRSPDILILDEATANIDTVTEQVLEDILKKLPKQTTRVIIAHRLNTIENADEIFFVNDGTITEAGNMEHAVEMLLHGNRKS